MIRKEIKQDNSFGGNYPIEIDYSSLPDRYIIITEEQRNFIDANIHNFSYDPTQEGIFTSPKGIVDISQTPEYLAKKISEAKNIKLIENQQKRDARLVAGIIYQNVLFDSDDAQLINIIGNTQLMSDADTVNWRGFDGVSKLVCTKMDLYNIGNLIRDLRSNIWDIKNPQIIEIINSAQTIEELEAINIDYSEV